MKNKLRLFSVFAAVFMACSLMCAAFTGCNGADENSGVEEPVKHTVTFSYGNGVTDGKNLPAPQTVEDGGYAVLPPEAPARDGYDFTGWYSSESAEESFKFETEKIYSDLTLSARWKAYTATTYSVTFDGGADEVINVPSAQHIKSGEYAAAPSEGIYRHGYIFGGWYTKAEGGELFDFEKQAITSDTALFARWKPTPESVRIACIGDSLTAGNYPKYLRQIFGDANSVGNFGRAGAFLTDAGKTVDRDNTQYKGFAAYKQSLDYNADIAVIMLGTNDSRAWSAASENYENELKEMIKAYRAVNPEMHIALMTSPESRDGNQWNISHEVIHNEINPIQRRLAVEQGTGLIDLHYIIESAGNFDSLQKGDGVHFSNDGDLYVARTVANYINTYLGKQKPATAEVTDVDLVLFAGQSNMAGRGSSTGSTLVPEGHAYDFRAISDPTKLYPLNEPFGVNENNAESGVTENKKAGSLVSALCESYYQKTNVPIVAVSCSKGGTDMTFWRKDGAPYKDACARMKLAEDYLGGSKNFRLRNKYVVWLQGESDGDRAATAEQYTQNLDALLSGFKEDMGLNHCFIIPIGQYNGSSQANKEKYDVIRNAQIAYAEANKDTTVISIQLADLLTYGLMKDNFHFYQEGYEIVGKDAGSNMAEFVLTGKAPECKHYVTAAAEPGASDIMYYDFEGGRKLPAGWEFDTTGGTAAIESGKLVLKTSSTSPKVFAAYEFQTPLSGKVVVEMRVKVGTSAFSNIFFLQTENATDTSKIALSLAMDSGVIRNNENAGWSTDRAKVADYVANVWYDFKLELDMDTATFDMTVNGLKYEGLKFRNPALVKDIKYLRIGANKSNVQMYYEYIRITQAD